MDRALHGGVRIVHTLPRLLPGPGLLMLECFAGRRVRYIAPRRLMVVPCVRAFAVFRVAIDRPAAEPAGSADTASGVAESDRARTPAHVRDAMTRQLASLAQAGRQAAGDAAATTALGLAGSAAGRRRCRRRPPPNA
ncbi:MAG: DUF3667 domain-containing protein [Xanthomonadaceae bacterium]|nr:DUF3667 domain-containing protein [Xanthomonadaceae bacterium]MDE1965130.1 DUF3667 domain-containing protein [Xanthomonadaceae bacterium]